MIDLFQYQDLSYKEFHQKLMPTVDKDTVIGVRTPVLRKLAKTDFDIPFLQALPHKYYEENNLHAFMLENIKDYDECVKRLEDFLPYLTKNQLDKWTHNKTIQKAVESYRITKEQKEYLKKLKRL